MKFFQSLKTAVTKKVIGTKIEKAITDLDEKTVGDLIQTSGKVYIDTTESVVLACIKAVKKNKKNIRMLAENNADTIVSIFNEINKFNTPTNKQLLKNMSQVVDIIETDEGKKIDERLDTVEKTITELVNKLVAPYNKEA